MKITQPSKTELPFGDVEDVIEGSSVRCVRWSSSLSVSLKTILFDRPEIHETAILSIQNQVELFTIEKVKSPTDNLFVNYKNNQLNNIGKMKEALDTEKVSDI